MKNAFRVIVLLVVMPATYYFIYWVPFSLIPFAEHRWIPTVISMLCAIGAGWYIWNKLGSTQYGITSHVALGALIFGGTGFSAGFFGPMIFTPDANQGPLLGIFITGPLGFIIGAFFGLIVGNTRNKDDASRISRRNSFLLKAWTWLLWVCGVLCILLILASLFYVPWHEAKYSNIIESPSDLQTREKTLKSLYVRSLSDDDIVQLQKFTDLNYLNFHAGWGGGDAKLTDNGLKKLSELNLPRLETIMLGYCSKITDEGMISLAQIKTLRYLSVAACPHISDTGLANLASSASIETIDLRGCTSITDRGLRYLKHMAKLKNAMLGGCINITQSGIEELRRSLPNSKIDKDDREWAMHTK